MEKKADPETAPEEPIKWEEEEEKLVSPAHNIRKKSRGMAGAFLVLGNLLSIKSARKEKLEVKIPVLQKKEKKEPVLRGI